MSGSTATAAAAAEKFIEKAGQKDTTVHETVAPAVTQETILPKRHEEVQIAADTEIHQSHYHTSVLPIQHTETLPEKHEYVVADAELKEHHHGDGAALQRLLADEAAKFKDSKTEAEVVVTTKEAEALRGEHVHHHVHEVIQPVIQKEVVVPTVVHTTIPIREIHHNEAKHHTSTSLPPQTLAEFQKQGGSLTGRPARTETFTGEPRAAGSTTSNTVAANANANTNINANVSGRSTPAPPGPGTGPQRRGTLRESSGARGSASGEV